MTWTDLCDDLYSRLVKKSIEYSKEHPDSEFICFNEETDELLIALNGVDDWNNDYNVEIYAWAELLDDLGVKVN